MHAWQGKVISIRNAIWAFALLGAWHGCKCTPIGGGNGAGMCARDTQCPKGQAYRKGQCVTERCDARNGSADCCPGQTCGFDGRCSDPLDQRKCTQDSDCTGGQVCSSRPELSAAFKVCSFPIPSQTGKCPSTYRLFDKRCIKDLPCGGGCANGQLCDIETNGCEAVPTVPTANSGCEVSCQKGTIKTLTDPDSMIFAQCCAIACQCEPLPPLDVGIYGKYASAAASPDEILVASYNETYGDLVLSHHDKITGLVNSLEFVDGMPTGGTVGGDAAGPRGGFSDPGPNVGQYASLSLAADNRPRIAYYDADNHDLKYAEKQTDGTWHVHVVDSAGDVGQFARLDYSAGKLRVAYFVFAGPYANQPGSDPAQYTTLRYGEAASTSPKSAADWQLRDAVQAQVARNPCGGACTSSDACVFLPPTNADTCAARDKDSGDMNNPCHGTAMDGQICATPHGGMKGFYYEDPVSSVTEIPPGLGLFPSMTVSNDQLLLTYYDNYTPPGGPPVSIRLGTLKGVLSTLTNGSAVAFGAAVALDKGIVCNSTKGRDVGRFTSVKVAASGRVGVAYADVTRGELRFYAAAPDIFDEDMGCIDPDATASNNGRVFVADSGIDIPDSSVAIVGADASLLFNTASKPYIAYQDQTNLAVKLAWEDSPGTWVQKVVSDQQGDGFEVQLVPDAGKVYLVSVKIGFDTLGNPENALIVRPITLP